MARATSEEQDFLVRLLFGELRQGALEGLMIEGIARAAHISPAVVRRAVMAEAGLGTVASIALREGEDGLLRFAVRLFRPVRPMLAQPADGVGDAFERLEDAALEYKVDGARVQIHKEGDLVRVFTRHLLEVTHAVPEIVALPVTNPTTGSLNVTLKLTGDPLVGSACPVARTMETAGAVS
jgi:DNA ligase-1